MNTKFIIFFGAAALLLHSIRFTKSVAAAEVNMSIEKAIAALDSRDEEARRRAIFAIRDEILVGPPEHSQPLVLLVAKFLADPDGTVRRAAAVTLFDIGTAARPACTALVSAVKAYPYDDVGIFAIDALTNIRMGSADWTAYLLQYLEAAPTNPAKVAALEALYVNSSVVDRTQLRELLTEILKGDTDVSVLEHAVRCMANVDIDAPVMWHRLERMASGKGILSQDVVLKFLTKHASQIDKNKAAALITSLLRSSDPSIRMEAEQLLARLSESEIE